MISEKFFAESYTSFWKELFPMGLMFIKNTNIESKTTGRRMSFISHISYIIWGKFIGESVDISYVESLNRNSVFEQIEAQAQKQFLQFNDGEEVSFPVCGEEFNDIKVLALAMIDFFRESKNIIVSPIINGCGIIDNCSADVIVDETLWELKCVNRSFKLNDFKQLFTYLSLNSVSRKYKISNLGLYNPRNNMHYCVNINTFSKFISGRNTDELYSDVINFITSENPSK